MGKGALRFSGHCDRGVKGNGKRNNRSTNNRENKKNHVGGCEPKQKWEEDRQQRENSVRGKENRYRDWETDRKSTRLNSSHRSLSRMPSSA